MSDKDQLTDESASEEAAYVPDPEKEKQARALHFTISIIRLLGVAILMLGIAISLGRLPPVPPFAGYVLAVIGLVQMLVIPLVMVRMYVKARVAEEETARAEAAADSQPEEKGTS
ncbi:hypothetical protein SAMN02745824_1259 [Parasphingorhabdus marina DSM 22363]|uniref:Uncharacterized protein n=1 Tax=Parasphingorhabdus marina DSM 22363 TaxID=1123272 RepID=A0A1N6CYR4_9SPHN|nr:hypothetical protein [Parasphingorhabdus marina]SIN63584.1 hypothetical protein SAMN02745824_1259 [Parasphingorhabdus marina DSM 22363]